MNLIYLELFISFVKIGFCSFGGLSMIPLIHQEMLSHGWMTAQQVSDLVAIAEMTPGSLGVNCSTFAGIHAGGTLGSLVATLGVLTPSLTLCLLAAHFLKKFKDNPHLNAVLRGIRPVCFGMIVASMASLAMTNYTVNGWIEWQSILVGGLVAVALLKFKFSIPAAIGLSALLGILLIP
jgi:chromate transporter